MIKLIWKLLKIILLAALLLLASAFAYHKGWLKQHPLSGQIEQITSGQLQSLGDLWTSFNQDTQTQGQLDNLSHNAGQQIRLMSEKVLEAGEVTKGFVAGAVQTDQSTDGEQSLSEKAFEYGQYIYCQAVVDDWQEQHPSSN